jgi:hypothetical protein
MGWGRLLGFRLSSLTCLAALVGGAFLFVETNGTVGIPTNRATADRAQRYDVARQRHDRRDGGGRLLAYGNNGIMCSRRASFAWWRHKFNQPRICSGARGPLPRFETGHRLSRPVVRLGNLYSRARVRRQELNSDLILPAPDNLARVAWMPVTRQPKAEYVRYVISFFKRQFCTAVGNVDQCAVA